MSKSPVPVAWISRSEELATATMENMAVKTDRFGQYKPNGGAFWNVKELTKDVLLRHYQGKTTIGLGTTSPEDECLWIVWDLDNPDGKLSPDVNLSVALRIRGYLRELGFNPLIEDSDGRGGIHLWIRLKDRAAALKCFAFAKEIATERDLSKGIEFFPKQASVQDTQAKCGNYLRLPGRHHKWDHWSIFYGKSGWLSIDESADLWRSPPSDDPSLVPDVELPPEDLTRRKAVPELDEDEYLEEFGITLEKARERAKRYLASGEKRLIAVEGNGGSNKTFHVASVLVEAYGLPVLDALEVMREWNAKCVPPWKDHELEKKLRDARDKIDSEKLGSALQEGSPYHWESAKEAFKDIESDSLVGGSGLNPSSEAVSADNAWKEKEKPIEFSPFPVDLLPEVLRDLIVESSGSIGCDSSFVALPILSVCSSCIGNSRELLIKEGWKVPSTLWTVIIGESGSQKSPSFRVATEPLKKLQTDFSVQFTFESDVHEQRVQSFKRDLKKWEKKQEGRCPVEPERPTRKRCIVQDITIEALASILNDNPRGVLLARDELSGWIASFDKYSGKGATSSDVQKWLEIYNCEPITVDRKTGTIKFISVPRPLVSICGGVQPDILSKCLTDEHKANGLQSRLLMAYPPRRSKRWRDEEVSKVVVDAYLRATKSLMAIQPDSGQGGNTKPVVLRLDEDAKTVFKEFVNRHGKEQESMHGHVASQWSKLEEIPARLSILIHCVRSVTTFEKTFASGLRRNESIIDHDTMVTSVRLTEWFKSETLRINSLLTESPELREARHLRDWIESRGGSITARDLAKNRRDINSSAEAESRLNGLVKRGAGEWKSIHNSRKFNLFC